MACETSLLNQFENILKQLFETFRVYDGGKSLEFYTGANNFIRLVIVTHVVNFLDGVDIAIWEPKEVLGEKILSEGYATRVFVELASMAADDLKEENGSVLKMLPEGWQTILTLHYLDMKLEDKLRALHIVKMLHTIAQTCGDDK